MRNKFLFKNHSLLKVSEFIYTEKEDNIAEWIRNQDLPRYENDVKEMLLQLKLDQTDRFLMATTGNGFVLWDLDIENSLGEGAMYLALPHGVRNISTKMMTSNSMMISSMHDYVVAGVRKNLYVWSIQTQQLMKVLDAHFGRIIQLEALTVGSWNSVITSSIDRSVKVWNINNIFEQVHVIDRHELQIDTLSLSKDGELAVTVTRGCVGVWEIRTGRLLSKLADSPLGAIVTHAEITPDSRYIISSETGKMLVWNRVTEQVLSRDDQPGVQQISLLDNGDKFLTVSCPNINAALASNSADECNLKATAIVRHIPSGTIQYSFEYSVRVMPGIPFRCAVISADDAYIIVVTLDKTNKDCMSVYNAVNGQHLHKVTLKGCSIKEILSLIPMPHKPNYVAVIAHEKGSIMDIKTKKQVRSIPKWQGHCTKDGKYGLYAPSR